MKNIGGLIFAVIAFFVWLIYKKSEDEKKAKLEAERKQAEQDEAQRVTLCNFFKRNLPEIKRANSAFNILVNFNNGYFSNYQLTVWNTQFDTLYKEIKGKRFQDINLDNGELKEITTFKDVFSKSGSLRSAYNLKFVESELKSYSSFFDNIEGRKLDLQQRRSIISDEDNNIVIAGAGSGKTTTIVGKVSYILDRYKVSPKEVLLISFTNKSAVTLAQRIGVDGIEAKTFHKLGKDIIAEVERKQPSIFDEKQFSPFILRTFNELIKDKNYLHKVTNFFSNFLKPPKSQFDFENQGDYIQYLKDQNFRSYKEKEIPTNGKSTYKMEIVKSIEECKIANFLLFNGVEYEYESPYENETADHTYNQYKPDFTIFEGEKRFYIEHFAVAKNGNVPKFFTKENETYEDAKKRYWDKIKWARELHKRHSTVLIETYSYEMNEETLFDNLTKSLTKCGITLRPKSSEEIWEIINRAAQDEVNGFMTLFGTFITLMKSNNYTFKIIEYKNQSTVIPFFKKRNELFLEIIKPIYQRYEDLLKERKEIDFSDMINKAAQYVTNGKYTRKLKYLIIDEFQDISVSRYELVKAIKSYNKDCKLFCVGDDWQSIYRFSGSDIALFKDFEKYFGCTVKSKIETTYRFNQPLIGLSSGFILKNPNQEKKDLKGLQNSKETSYRFVYSTTDNQDDTITMRSIFQELMSFKDIERKEILVVGRYSFDINRIKNDSGLFDIDKEEGVICYSDKKIGKSLKANYLTVHKSKGLEADIVIVINCNSGKHGFPSEISDDHSFKLLLSESDQFENGEERRLFYVAMTRAKEMVYFVSDSSYKSKFITELETESKESKVNKCPKCLTADVLLKKNGIAKNGNAFKYYGCSNFLYGCDYSLMEWDNLPKEKIK